MKVCLSLCESLGFDVINAPPRLPQPVSVATNAELTYKYAIFEGVNFSHWEPIGTNKEGTRTIRVQEDQVRRVGEK